MRTARPLGLSPDGRTLFVATDDGEQLAVPADERLRAALRGDRPRLGQLEIHMESALRPREIQARIRAGESLEDVARAAGVPPEQLEGFATPVLAERDHVASLAQAAPVRRAGETIAHRTLRSVVTERLLSRGIDADTVAWDAWRIGDRRWWIKLDYDSGSSHHEAVFSYDQTGRFSVATNEEARWLLGESPSPHGPQPGRRRRRDEPEEEITLDLNDELAIIRAIQPNAAPEFPRPVEVVAAEDAEDSEDAYVEADLAEVDGLYDFVPAEQSNLDVLYDMLASFDEDSVQIYAGLVRPSPDAEQAVPVLDDWSTDPEPEPEPEPEPRRRPRASAPRPEVAEQAEPEQPSLVDDAAPENEPSRPIKRRRAAVPTWDEIMFGAPTPSNAPPKNAPPKKRG